MSRILLSTLLAGLAVFSANADEAPTVYQGVLEDSDEYNDNQKYVDTYTLDIAAGQALLLDLQAEDWDCFLIAVSPIGEQFFNDDFDRPDHSFLEAFDARAGQWTIYVTSFTPDTLGAYTLTVRTTEQPYMDSLLRADGDLASGDTVTYDGKFLDTYEIELEQGEQVWISMESEDFSTFLSVAGPGRYVNQDQDHAHHNHGNGQTASAFINFTANATGTYQVFATSVNRSESGGYRLIAQRGGN